MWQFLLNKMVSPHNQDAFFFPFEKLFTVSHLFKKKMYTKAPRTKYKNGKKKFSQPSKTKIFLQILISLEKNKMQSAAI